MFVTSCLLVGCLISFSAGQETLSVAIITRHADRYPNGDYPGDPYASLFEKTGYGVLTPKGRVQSYTIGKNLRKHFPQLTKRNVTLLTSSDVPRTRETVQLILQGLNGPSASINHQNIHVTSTKDTEDALLNHPAVNCSKRKAAVENDINLKLINLSYTAIWAPVAHILAAPIQVDPVKLYYYLEDIFTEFTLGLEMPEWATDKLFQRIKREIDLEFWFTSQLDIEGKLSGVFYEELINQFKRSLESKNVTFLAYGTHDTSLAPIMVNLDLWPDRRPAVGEALIFVLKTDGHLEAYFYQENHQMVKQVLPGCDESVCTLHSFEKAVQHFIPKDWRTECLMV